MGTPIYVVDAFTDHPFTGNPAGVCILSEEADSRWMQNVAAEMRHAETAFLRREGDRWSLRWFTPTVEVDLCGHATIASAHVLWSTGRLSETEEAIFDTQSGELRARREADRIVLNFPAEPVNVAATVREGLTLSAALGLHAPPKFVGRNRMDWFVEASSEAEVEGLTPELELVGQLGHRGVIVTAASSMPDADFVSRFFAPQSGVDEDPVTGSAHCCLAPYWAGKLGKNEMVGFQASARGGYVGVRVIGERVELIGTAVTILSGELAAGPPAI